MEGSSSPRSNKLLAALSDDCWRVVQPCLSPSGTAAGQLLYQAGDQVQWLYFPVSGVVARFIANENAQSTEFSVCGDEGAVGLTAALGGPSLGTAMTLCESAIYRCPAQKVVELMNAHEFRTVLLRYTHYMITEIIQGSLCNKHHTTEQRFSRWLLMCLDRAQTFDLEITHDVVGRLLGVRREGVSEVVGRLRAQGIIDVGRRHLIVRDRMALLARSCDCYQTLLQNYSLLLNPRALGRPIVR